MAISVHSWRDGGQREMLMVTRSPRETVAGRLDKAAPAGFLQATSHCNVTGVTQLHAPFRDQPDCPA
eukprot:gene19464-19888_t